MNSVEQLYKKAGVEPEILCNECYKEDFYINYDTERQECRNYDKEKCYRYPSILTDSQIIKLEKLLISFSYADFEEYHRYRVWWWTEFNSCASTRDQALASLLLQIDFTDEEWEKIREVLS